MATHSGSSNRTGAGAPAPRPPEQVRNVALVGRAGAGKTTLAEALLAAAGALPRAGRVEEGTTCLDTEEVEVRLQHSVSLAAATVEHAGHRVTLLDTPGAPDFVGELRAALRAADAALVVVSAVAGVDAGTVQLWDECAAVGLPRAVVVTQVDRPRADVPAVVRSCRELLGAGVHPLHVLGDDGALTSLLEPLPGDPERDRLRAELIEGVIAESEDETLMDRYLAGEPIGVADLVADLETAVARGDFHPVLCTAPPTGLGVAELLDLLVSAFPSPLERPCPAVARPDGRPAGHVGCDPAGPLVAEVVKTTTDPYLGRISLVRVFSGTLRPDVPVHVGSHGSGWGEQHPDHDADERVGGLASVLGSVLRPVAECPAGDLCAVARLSSAETGDTLSDPEHPLVVRPWPLPDPQLPVAVEAASRSDEDRLAGALTRLAAEDPAVRVERRPDTGQLLLWCVGDAHAEVLLDRLRGRYGVAVHTPPVQVPMVETLAGPATVTGRHVKQSGGHGQYAVVVLEGRPGAAGSGVTFSQRVVGGAVPIQFHASVEKGVRAQAARGISGNRPLVDVEVVLVDGKAHSVDSSDAAFSAAGALALRELAAAAGTQVLEPWCAVEVTVPAEHVGPVLGDLAGRRARVTGSVAEPEREETTVHAEVPERELITYPRALRSVSHGTGRFTRRPLGHEPAPAAVVADLQPA
ncbi:elongation factor G-like protein EF-G2 [Modestobacter sp. VKM Ac-2979]|uniref:elongation factor G-like protein EF-G2 n=1 Tax=unclassified Modestobacter TaxID=2643866 RepID=UPI0022AB5BC6|nr:MULTISPECIES: elongation factor G-like protein EF-G2 [unclassified Modestobacter]MCZ2812771.1 elongation factor G-like protein EF-G2 [Modestobacter sp. VKM Ac-2979]MCZ2843200.1 elongation factor G-like protein EF-G2 [Modestobacter sp. VKM Ac-2980]